MNWRWVIVAVACAGWCGCATTERPEAEPVRDVESSRTDEVIGAEVRRRLNGVGAEATGVMISVMDGVVTLNGPVRNEITAMRAEAAARSVPGVKSVRNDLMIGRPSY